MKRVFSYSTLQKLYEAAHKVLDKGASIEELRQPLEELDAMVEFRRSARGQAVLEEACDLHSGSEGAIDDATIVYRNGTDGYRVMRWCFVPDSDEDEDEGANELPPSVVVDKPPS